MSTKAKVVLLVVCAALTLLAWMTRYRYEVRTVHVVRINRISGQVCYSQPDGSWSAQPFPKEPVGNDPCN